MSAFGIFALILTTAYIIYFAVVICRDILAGRKKADSSADSETFDVSAFTQEESIEVKETSGGFAIGETETQTQTVMAPQQDESTESNDEKKESEDLASKITDKMEDIDDCPEFQQEMDAFVFRQHLMNDDGNSHLVRRIEIAAEEPPKPSVSNAPDRDHF